MIRYLLILLALSTTAMASAVDWSVVFSTEQSKLLAKDNCAVAAVEAAMELVAKEEETLGVRFPDRVLKLLDLKAVQPKRLYVITFEDDYSTMTVQTKMIRGRYCKATTPSRITPQ